MFYDFLKLFGKNKLVKSASLLLIIKKLNLIQGLDLIQKYYTLMNHMPVFYKYLH